MAGLLQWGKTSLALSPVQFFVEAFCRRAPVEGERSSEARSSFRFEPPLGPVRAVYFLESIQHISRPQHVRARLGSPYRLVDLWPPGNVHQMENC